MAVMFHPKVFVMVDTQGRYHPKNSQFKVSLGLENDTFVSKVQLVVDGKIRPRLTVSYDEESNQFTQVFNAYLFLNDWYNHQDYQVRNQLKGLELTEAYRNSELFKRP